MPRKDDRKESEKITIFEYETAEKKSASKVLKLAKEQELKKLTTHVWQISLDGKTSKLIKK